MSEQIECSGLICFKCGVPLITEKTNFNYLRFNFSTDLPRCPKCGQVYIPEELVSGRMHEVETELEDK
jgi:hypothetical protein